MNEANDDCVLLNLNKYLLNTKNPMINWNKNHIKIKCMYNSLANLIFASQDFWLIRTIN